MNQHSQSIAVVALWSLLSIASAACASAACAAERPGAPTLRDTLSLPQVGNPKLSPSGEDLLFTVTSPDWENNRYDSEIYLSRDGAPAIALTQNTHGSSTEPRWSPDGRFVAFLADGEDGPQIYRIALEGSESRRVTALPGGLINFEWSPDSRQMSLLLIDAPDAEIQSRSAEYGDFEILGESAPTASLWLLDVSQAITSGGAGPGSSALRRITDRQNLSVTVFSVDGFRLSHAFSPAGKSIVFSHGTSVNVMDSIHANISLVDLETMEVRTLVESENWDETPLFSPDGQDILFTRTVIADWLADKQLMIVPAAGGEARAIPFQQSDLTDTQPLLLDWTSGGISVFFQQGTGQHVFSLNPQTGQATRLTESPRVVKQFTASNDGRAFAYLGFDAESAPEIYWQVQGRDLRQFTDVTDRTAGWARPRTEPFHWTAPDGVEIEGILYSPADLAPGDAAPLIFVLHGGPRDAENPRLVHDQLYPVQQWLAAGSRVLFPNYRGSTGYGAAFRKLTLRNIGRAESLDVIAAFDTLAASDIIEGRRVGIAGHSWGGYLAAYLSASTDRFCVASVGSGITDNRVNYVLSAAGVAREGYLGSFPWQEPALWDETSPVHYVGRAGTPTLIQHGEDDRVVPVENAYLFYRGLRDMGVPVQAVVFKDTGHNVSRPKEKLAWMQQNLDWFERYLWASPCVAPVLR